MPAHFPSDDLQADITTHIFRDSISEIQKIAEYDDPTIEFPPECQQILREVFSINFLFRLRLSKASMKNVVDRVRDNILDWSMSLEQAGIVGEDLSFSTNEKTMAQNVTINGNVGMLGNSHAPANIGAGSGDVNQALDAAAISRVVDEIRATVPPALINGNDQFAQNLDALASEAENPTPSNSRLRGAMRAVKDAAGSIGNSIIEAGVRAAIDRVMG